MNITMVCDDSFDGIMSAIYDGWILMNKGNSISIHPGREYAPTFFSEYVYVETNIEKASKVASSIRVKISVDAYMMVFRACMHYEKDKGNAILGFLKLGYSVGANVTNRLNDPCVMRVMELSRKAVNEAHLFKGFIRFKELKGDVLYSKIEPKCDVLALLENHFSNRFPEENWIIYDEKRKKAIVHKIGSEVIFVYDRDMDEIARNMECNSEYEDLWNVFFNTIGIDARHNPKCQRNLLPKWYRNNMTEFK